MIRAFGQYAQNQSDYSVLVDQINKINSQINVVVNKYNSISNDIFSVSSNISTFNENLNRVTLELNNINQSIASMESELDKFSNSNYSLVYYITEPVLSKPLYQYNNYSTLQSTGPIIVFEPYVQSITRTSDLEGRYWFAYNLPNATLQFTNESLPPVATNRIGYEGLTCAKLEADYFDGTSYSVGTYSVRGAFLTRCSGQYLEARDCKLYDCDIHQIKLNATGAYATISNCILKNVSATKVALAYCLGVWVTGKSNTFIGCSLASYPISDNNYRVMNLNHVGNMKNCEFESCELNCTINNSSYSFVNCSFDNASIYHLTHTRFINCSGNVFVPRFINGVNMFDNNNQYLGGLPTTHTYNTSSTYTLTNTETYNSEIEIDIDTSSTYTGKYTFDDVSTSYSTIETTTNYTYQPPTNTNTILEDTTKTTMYDTYTTLYDGEVWTATRTDFIAITRESTGTLTDNYQIPSLTLTTLTNTITNTLTDNYSTSNSYDQQLTVNILPEWRTPNIFTNNIIDSQYLNTYVNIDYYKSRMNNFELNNCTGNVMMYLDSISENFIIANNQLYKCELNLGDYGSQFVITANNIKNLDLYLNSNDTPGFTMSMNNIDKMNLLYNFTANSSIIFEKNSFKDFNINAAAKGNLRMSSCTINNGKLYGWNGLYSCTANYIENYGENSYSNNTINTLRAHNIKLMYDNIIDKLIIEPNQYDNLSFYGNSIKTLIIPSYFPVSASAVHNTFDTIIVY